MTAFLSTQQCLFGSLAQARIRATSISRGRSIVTAIEQRRLRNIVTCAYVPACLAAALAGLRRQKRSTLGG